MKQVRLMPVKGREEGERTLDVLDTLPSRANVSQWEAIRGRFTARDHRRGAKPQEGRLSIQPPSPTSDEAEQKTGTAHGQNDHKAKAIWPSPMQGSKRKTPRTGNAAKVAGDGPTR